MIFETNASSKMTVDSSGNVNIGSSSQTVKLTLDNTLGKTLINGSYMSLSDSSTVFDLYHNGRAGVISTSQAASGYPICLQPTSSYGKVGIGTYTPTQKLEVNGTVYIIGNDTSSSDVEETHNTSVVKNTMSVIGEHSSGGRWGSVSIASNLGEVNVEINDINEKGLTVNDFINRWRERVGEIPEAIELKFGHNTENPKEAINIEVSSMDNQLIPQASAG